MRTTLDIAEDVLQAVKERARAEGRTAGEVVTELVRDGLTSVTNGVVAAEPKAVYGFRPFPRRGVVVTNELINKIRDEDAY